MSKDKYKSFFNIVPRDEVELEEMHNPLSLNVVRGIDTKPDLNIKVNDLSHGYKQFYNTGSVGISFKIKVIIDKDETFNDIPVTQVLDGYARNMTPVGVKTNAIDVPDDVYLITENPSRSQELDRKTVWELTFMTYNPVNVFKYENDNAGVKKALNKTKSKVIKNAKFRKCDYKKLKYSEKKKVVKCVKYMQEILYNNKYLTKKQIDGWFGKSTKSALKKFQKAYNKKNKIKVKTTKKGANGIAVTEGKLVTKVKDSNKYVTKSVKKKFKKKKINTKKAKGGSSTAVVKSVILPENGKVDKATYKVLCNS